MSRDRTRLRIDGCAPDEILKRPLDPRIRPTDKCGPGETPVPEIFKRPGAVPEFEIDPRDLPAALVIRSPATELGCADIPGGAPIGDNVLVLEGTYERQVSWVSVKPSLDTSRLKYISGLAPAILAPLLDPTTQPTEGYLKSNFKLNSLQAQDLIALLKSAGDRVTALALIEATTLLDCVWTVDTGTATCPPDIYGNPAESNTVPPVEPYTNWVSSQVGTPVSVSGLWASPESEAVAQALADAVAEAQLKCIYTNDTLTLTCADLNPLAVDPFSGGATTITISARAFASVDKVAADQLAYNYAASQLDCYFTNDEVTVTCVDDLGYAPADAADFAASAVPSFTVAAGTYISRVSVEDADRMANVEALQGLSCIFENVAINNSCINEPVITYYPYTISDVDVLGDYALDDGGLKLIPTLNSSAGSVAAGQFTSTVDQASVDAIAQAYALRIKVCEYCNPTLTSPCPPESVNALTGLAEGTICGQIAQVTMDLAIAAGSQPAGAGASGSPCLFESTADTYACPAGVKASISTGSGTIAAGLFVSTDSVEAANIQRDAFIDSIRQCFVSNTGDSFPCPTSYSTPGDTMSATCTPSFGGNFEIPETSFIANVLDYVVEGSVDEAAAVLLAQAYVDGAEDALKLAFKGTCLYENNPVAKTCEDVNDNPETPNGPGAFNAGNIAGGSVTAATCSTANGLAEEIALSKLNCVYSNTNSPTHDCSDVGLILIRIGSVDTGEVVSYVSSAAANAAAVTLANVSSICVSDDLVGGGVNHPDAKVNPCGDESFEICATITGAPCLEEAYPTVEVSVTGGVVGINGEDTTITISGIINNPFVISAANNKIHVYASFNFTDANATQLDPGSGDDGVFAYFSADILPDFNFYEDVDDDGSTVVYIGSVTLEYGVFESLTDPDIWCWSASVSQARIGDITLPNKTGKPHPFQIVASQGGTASKVQVVYGTVNNKVPAKVAVDLSSAHEFAYGEKLWLEVTVNASGDTDSVDIITNAGTPSDSATKGHLLIGEVNASGVIAQSIKGSQQAVHCYELHYWNLI